MYISRLVLSFNLLKTKYALLRICYLQQQYIIRMLLNTKSRTLTGRWYTFVVGFCKVPAAGRRNGGGVVDGGGGGGGGGGRLERLPWL